MEQTLSMSYYNRPFICSECGSDLIFKGVGEYHCEKCKTIEYDDYGKIRIFLEKHQGANMTQIEEATGVNKKIIKQMVKEGRFEIAQNSKVFHYCERCNAKIASGRFCHICEMKYNRELEEKSRIERKKFEGTAVGIQGEKGAKRFERKK